MRQKRTARRYGRRRFCSPFGLLDLSAYMPDTPLDLFLFTADVETALRAEAAGIENVIVDWEQNGKRARQNGHDTEINNHSVEAVSRLASTLSIPVTVRINPFSAGTRAEVQRALDCGASTLMLPMATDPVTVETFVRLVAGRAKTLIQIETHSLVEQCEALQSIGWDYAHVGLNDLKISRGSRWLWAPLVDGTIERVLRTLDGRCVGFGGATVVGGGTPIPFIHLFQEMSRLNAGMALLRRSFFREVAGGAWTAEINALRSVWTALRERCHDVMEVDHARLMDLLHWLEPAPPRLIPQDIPLAHSL